VLDLVLPDGDGITLLGELRACWPAMPALVMTGYVEPRSIVEAMRRGAVDYLPKPIDPDVFLSSCRNALAHRAAPAQSTLPAEPLPIIGDSAATARMRETIQRLARSRPSGIRITGDDGVGKTWMAFALHAASMRRGAPCLLFSCVKAHQPIVALLGMPGSTTGGLLAAAQGGTVVLDAIECLDGEAQLRLLRWVDNARAGAPLLIGLTSRPDAESPLLGWLGRATIAVPPLRDRTGDILPLARHFLLEASTALGRRFDGFAPAAEQRLLAHTWPGNVRELRDTVMAAAGIAAGGFVQADQLCMGSGSTGALPWAPVGDPRPLREIEEAYIDHVLAVTGGNKTRAARLLGVARETLRIRMLARSASQ
jgi:DNA-binding NtrC family response regulator